MSPADEEALAARMFPSMRPAEQPAPAPEATMIVAAGPAPAEQAPAADDVSPIEEQAQEPVQAPVQEPPAAIVVPEHIAKLRELAVQEEPALRSFPPEKQLTAITEAMFDSTDLGSDQRREVVNELRRMSSDLGFGNNDINEFLSRASVARNEDPEAQRAAANVMLRRTFGDGAEAALADARALVKRDPRALQLLEGMGLGNDGETIVKLARQARRERARGRLK
ncbi:MAG: hypothetical protein Q7J47_06010 [Azoarcus sp.]|nr:hypothetical protein [Azoarcus sp.]